MASSIQNENLSVVTKADFIVGPLINCETNPLSAFLLKSEGNCGGSAGSKGQFVEFEAGEDSQNLLLGCISLRDENSHGGSAGSKGQFVTFESSETTV